MLAVFGIAAALMVVRALPALLAVPLMALAFAALAGASPASLGAVVTDGTVKLAVVYVTVIFGALLSRVTMATGIAETIVAYAAELGGDRPIVLALVLGAVVAVLFTTLTGLGAIIMVGSIVLPIMMTVGVPRKTAAAVFLLAFALGFIFNIAQWTFYTTTFGVDRTQLQPYAYVLAAIDFVALLTFVLLRFRSTRGSATWALALDEDEPPARRRVPPYALVTPILPIVCFFAFSKVAGLQFLASPVVAFALAALFGVLTTRPRDAIATLVAAAIRGVEDVAPAVLLFMGIGMLLAATALPEVKAALAPLVAAVAPRNAIAYVLVFGLLSPLALYRGPLNPFGVGIAVYTVLAGLHVLPAAVLVAAVMAVVQVQNVCDPTNTQNVWVANFTGVRVGEITALTLPVQVAVATAGTLAVALFGTALLGTPPLGSGIAPAAAATLALSLDPNRSADATPAPLPTERSPFPVSTPVPAAARETPAPGVASGNAAYPGLQAPSAARATIAVVAAPGPESALAATAVARALGRGWGGVRALAVTAPGGGDCRARAYVAIVHVGAERYRGGGSPTLATDLALSDCADWPVMEWHDQQTYEREPVDADVRAQALGALLRMRVWSVGADGSAGFTHLLETGVADLGATPTYLYALYKTPDGQMRAFVRAGGPAYAAGMRTNDIVEQLDGKYWWEYGTFQTQRRAYDGLPHRFVMQHDGGDVVVQLGAPYRG